MNWKNTVNLKHIWSNDTLSAEDKGKAIAKLLKIQFSKSLNLDDMDNYDGDLDGIIEGFNCITGYDGTTPIEELDDVMEAFYDWGDQEVPPFDDAERNKQCWIKGVF